MTAYRHLNVKKNIVRELDRKKAEAGAQKDLKKARRQKGVLEQQNRILHTAWNQCLEQGRRADFGVDVEAFHHEHQATATQKCSVMRGGDSWERPIRGGLSNSLLQVQAGLEMRSTQARGLCGRGT